MMAILHSNYTQENLAALEMKAEQEIDERRWERARTGKLRIPKKTMWDKGQEYARLWTKEEPDSVPFKLQDYRARVEAAKLHYADPEVAPRMRRTIRINKSFCQGVVSKLEHYCRQVGLHVPTQAEKDEEAIERLLAMELEGVGV
jgi:hypothetical protein